MDKYETIKLDNQLCFSLYAASREVIKLYKPVLDKYNLTYTQYVTMLVLWEEEKITVKEIGKRLHLDSGTLTSVLKKLEGMELIIRYRDPTDDRVVVIELDEKGRLLKDEILEVPELIACKVGITIEEFMVLKKSLDELLKKFS
ncbi:MarR family transcriptional regulator [Clostridium bowmanii]|uniref:MarR family winged helix-turn-helix transcriptional regulator n=1 Tax=Clostridium bowmanii TaxID=132925 RepID=UPI001C0AE942|nr:MarR family transcriptional regulator [Clostridium bowmanii]MBU3189562.1 MarR family transcriptional regulator [Clostridium bowmanii]MCA1073596.1 MarR family transcriptional regulator [Clostridium bowmanii]